MIRNYEPNEVDPTEGGLLPVDYPPLDEGGPRIFYRRTAEKLYRHEHHRFGHPTRPSAPTIVVYGPGEVVEREEWHEFFGPRSSGRKHRADGPAQVHYYRDGSIRRETYYRENVITRDDGPADITQSTFSGHRYEYFYLDGQMVSATTHEGFRAAIAAGAPREWALAYVRGEAS